MIRPWNSPNCANWRIKSLNEIAIAHLLNTLASHVSGKPAQIA